MKSAHDFTLAKHTFIVSDIHLTTAEPRNPKFPLWKRYKQKQFFIDESFEVFLDEIHKVGEGHPVELILAGDIFDFDGVNQLPKKHRFTTTWLELKRGLNTEERKSRFKMKLILEDHPVFVRALSKFVKKGNRIVFIIGNHDLELHWMSVQHMVKRAIGVDAESDGPVRFNNWFYLSNKDTLIEHGNQHDSHSNCQNPINPKIRGLYKERIRLPFGCLANRYLINGMGSFNPHSDRSYLMTFPQYIKFAFKYLLRREPLIMWTWVWGAFATLLVTLRDGLLPDVKDPLIYEDLVEAIAKNSNATPRIVRSLKEVHSAPSFTDPLGIARELWLDRVIIIFMTFLVGFWVMSVINFVVPVSYWWMLAVILLFMPFWMFYFRSFKSKVIVPVKFYERAVKLSSKITGVNRVVYGHTHEFVHTNFDGIEYLNAGTWSPAFDDIECTRPTCPKTFVWIRPATEAELEKEPHKRVANVFEWSQNQIKLLC